MEHQSLGEEQKKMEGEGTDRWEDTNVEKKPISHANSAGGESNKSSGSKRYSVYFGSRQSLQSIAPLESNANNKNTTDNYHPPPQSNPVPLKTPEESEDFEDDQTTLEDVSKMGIHLHWNDEFVVPHATNEEEQYVEDLGAEFLITKPEEDGNKPEEHADTVDEPDETYRAPNYDVEIKPAQSQPAESTEFNKNLDNKNELDKQKDQIDTEKKEVEDVSGEEAVGIEPKESAEKSVEVTNEDDESKHVNIEPLEPKSAQNNDKDFDKPNEFQTPVEATLNNVSQDSTDVSAVREDQITESEQPAKNETTKDSERPAESERKKYKKPKKPKKSEEPKESTSKRESNEVREKVEFEEVKESKPKKLKQSKSKDLVKPSARHSKDDVKQSKTREVASKENNKTDTLKSVENIPGNSQDYPELEDSLDVKNSEEMKSLDSKPYSFKNDHEAKIVPPSTYSSAPKFQQEYPSSNIQPNNDYVDESKKFHNPLYGSRNRKKSEMHVPLAIPLKEMLKEKDVDVLSLDNEDLIYVGYLEFDNGEILGPFRWDLDKSQGLKNRTTDVGTAHDHSSRSHSLFTVMVDSQVKDDSTSQMITRHGKLTFVDLAGSESIDDSIVHSPEHLLETSSINKSLLVLSNCIHALSDQKKKHVPYRDSKLTKILSDSIGGNGVSLMIACVNPNEANNSETMNTLRYASRAKKIVSSPEVKLDPKEELVRNLQREVESLKLQNDDLKEKLSKSSSQQVSSQSEPGRPLSENRPLSKGSYTSLYEMLQEYMHENESLKHENLDLNKYRTEFRKEQDLLAQENKRLAMKLDKLYRQIEVTKQAMAVNQKPIYISNPESRGSPAVKQEQHFPADRYDNRFPPINKKGSEGVLSLTSLDEVQSQPVSNPLLPALVHMHSQPNSKQTISSTQSYQEMPHHTAANQQRPLLYLPESVTPRPQNFNPNYFETNLAPAVVAPPATSYSAPMAPPMQQMAPPHQVYIYQNPLNTGFKQSVADPIRYYPDAPSYVPKDGERTYRGRFVNSTGGDVGNYNTQKQNKLQLQSKAYGSADKLNDELRKELRNLDGAIQQHQKVNSLNKELRKRGRKVLKT